MKMQYTGIITHFIKETDAEVFQLSQMCFKII